ncbi:MAG: B12-binding domain-containing radical SAM protein [Deltaproteobacteria bacterium]|nr:B12-binding domain-containing radical SAM protein [Deltaproteobacteria bacterium]
MDVLLVNPRYNGRSEIPPLGLECIAAVLSKHAIDAAIIDLDIDHQQEVHDYFLRLLQTHMPKIVGVTAMSHSFASAITVCQIVKDYSQNILTVLGGIHATVLYNSILREQQVVDVIVRGEGELSFLELTQNFLKGRPFSYIDGISFHNDGKTVHNNDRGLTKDLDSFPLPSHNLVENEKYKTRSISSSRGCFHNCTFCSIRSLYGNIIRIRSVDTIIEETEDLIRYGARRIMFTDENFTFSLKRVRHLCNEIVRRRLHKKVVFYAEGRIDDICQTPIMAQLLSDAGFKGLYIGAESGSQKILNYYRKEMAPDTIVQGVSYCIEQNLLPIVNFILFGPRDTVDSIKETINIAKKVYESGAEIVYAEMLIPYPGTPIKTELEKEGKFKEVEGIYYFESYEGLDIEWILQCCNAARDMAYLTHKDDLFFSTKKTYFELCCLDELLENRIPSEFEELYQHHLFMGNVPEMINNTHRSVGNLIH